MNNKKIIVPALLGASYATKQTLPDISVFADNLWDMAEDGDDSIRKEIQGVKDYTDVFKKLETKRKNGELQSTDAFKDIEFIANENGFKTEKHQVVTEDGYVLGIWRIPGKLQNEIDDDKKPVVLLQHGLECDMMQWVFNRPEVAPAFVMARAGYDVWLGNNRGNRFSQ